KARERITDLVDIDDTALGALDIVIGRLQQLAGTICWISSARSIGAQPAISGRYCTSGGYCRSEAVYLPHWAIAAAALVPGPPARPSRHQSPRSPCATKKSRSMLNVQPSLTMVNSRTINQSPRVSRNQLTSPKVRPRVPYR